MYAAISSCRETTRFLVEHHNLFSGAVNLERQLIFAVLYKSTASFFI
jgi:hypothetical protein